MTRLHAPPDAAATWPTPPSRRRRAPLADDLDLAYRPTAARRLVARGPRRPARGAGRPVAARRRSSRRRLRARCKALVPGAELQGAGADECCCPHLSARRRPTLLDASLQHADPTRRGVRPVARRRGPHVRLRPDGLRPRPHRQLPHLRRRRPAAPHAAPRGRLRGARGDELHRRRRPDDPRVAQGRRPAARVHRLATSRRSARTRRRSGSSRSRSARAPPTRPTCAR